MGVREKKASFLILLLSGFIDYAGIAIVYPLFAYLLFDPSFHFLPIETSSAVRGLWLGVLISLHPLFQLFCAPIFGSLSDVKGRKPLLLGSFSLGLVGYLIAIAGLHLNSLPLLALYRVCGGISGGNSSIISAVVADLSSTEAKARNYGLLNMSFGAGFTIGPFLSGFLAHQVSLTAPFIIAFFLVALNLFLVWWKLEETCPPSDRPIRPRGALQQLRAAGKMGDLRLAFLSLLIFSLGWSFLTEFIPLFLIDRFGFTPTKIGLYYGYTGVFFSLSSGFLIFPIIRYLGVERSLLISMLCSGGYLLLFSVIETSFLMWLYLPLSQFFLSFVYPGTSAIISNQVPEERQGEVMGIYQAVIALALAITPFLSGTLVGSYPILTVIISGLLMGMAGLVFLPVRIRVYRSERE